MGLLRRGSLLNLWIGQMVSRSGDFIFEVAAVWIALKLTGSVFDVGITVAVTFLPAVLVSPIAGVYVDRTNRRGVLLLSNSAQAAICLVMAGFYLSGRADFPLFLALLFALGAVGSFTSISISAMIPRLVSKPELPTANGLFSVSTSFNQLLGYGLGGIVILLLGPGASILYDGFTFAFAVVMVSFVSSAYGEVPQEGHSQAARSIIESFGDGLRFIRSNAILGEIVLLALAANFFGGALSALLAPYAERVLGGDAASYGFLLATFSLGAVLGALVVGRFDMRNTVGRVLFGGVACLGALSVALGAVSALWLALPVALSMGFIEAAINIPVQVLVQSKIPAGMLGRTVGTLSALLSLALPIASFVSGAVASWISIPRSYEVFGLALVLIALAGGAVLGDLRDARY